MHDDCRTPPSHAVTGVRLSRREFLRYAAGAYATLTLTGVTFAGGDGGKGALPTYPIDPDVRTTVERMLAFPARISPGLPMNQLHQVAQYDRLGYGKWTFGAGLPVEQRYGLMGSDAAPAAPARLQRFARFFAFSDIHITDKEAPNQLIAMQQIEPMAANNTSIYSPVMMTTTHVLDAAVQTVNALHKRDPFDFGISLGDTCNNTSYNELRWYLDVIDGKPITPSSGAHAGADRIDYQKPFQAAGLDRSIPWFQALGNHDHFYIGSFPVDADPGLGLRASYVADTVWNKGDVLRPTVTPRSFPVMFDMQVLRHEPTYYMGTFDGSTPDGTLVGLGLASAPAFAAGAPRVVADPDRRSLRRAEWIREFFRTTTTPVGHGFHLVDPALQAANGGGFACYSFVPNPRFPLKVIVLDDTQVEDDGSNDIHGHGYLDATRWAWLRAELDAGQAANQLMIVAAHVPIGVSAIGTETEWWQQTEGIAPRHRNACTLAELVDKLWHTPNLLMWLAGHRHLNVVKSFAPPAGAPREQGFWQVETSSLRDCPQQFRTFDLYLNSDYSVSIVTVNVDPSVAEGTPAATSRRYAIATQQIVGNALQVSEPNLRERSLGGQTIPLPSMDPSRPQDASGTPDPSIRFTDLTQARFQPPVPVNGSYNGELFKPLSPQMVAVLKRMFPQGA